ncbi:hypothetical protein HanHA300_Chr04g0127681 [Helianthus annuus]|nr:hypothetical protein HanHA300_Chr04g0127681 [Helianthus annuus]KAJ0596247.1 hypothetical protein HanHA89_Chr04g0140621 [Helianthus annuus]KAJ0756907.1 hypothetical protein HanLR1_Chr04g0132451 [Helianthus annuus]
MKVEEHYSEVMDIVGRLFVEMFDKLNERCEEGLEAISNTCGIPYALLLKKGFK